MRALLSAVAVAVFAGTVIVAPFTMPPSAADELSALQPGEMPSQELIAEAAELAEYYEGELAVSRLPDPKPTPVEPVTQSESAAPSTPAAPPTYTGGGSPAEWMTAAGIAPEDWGYVNFIAEKESGWNPNATNSSSGACGLIQAHPCSKVPGNGYDPVDNLRWASGYAQGRYGGWQQAYDFWVSNHWW